MLFNKAIRLTLPRMILLSGLLHAVLMATIMFSAFPGRATTFYRPQYQVRLVGPEEIPSSMPSRSEGSTQPAKPPEPAKEVKKVIIPEEKKPEKQVQQTVEKPKKEPSPQKPSKAPSKETKKEDTIEEALKRVRSDIKYRNLLASKGSSSSGALTGSEGNQQYNEYYDQIYERIRENWIPPENYDPSAADIVTVVSLSILPDGKIENSWIEKSSGDRYFDESVMRALLKSNPLPSPPVGFNKDVGLRFHSNPDYATTRTP